MGANVAASVGGAALDTGGTVGCTGATRTVGASVVGARGASSITDTFGFGGGAIGQVVAAAPPVERFVVVVAVPRAAGVGGAAGRTCNVDGPLVGVATGGVVEAFGAATFAGAGVA